MVVKKEVEGRGSSCGSKKIGDERLNKGGIAIAMLARGKVAQVRSGYLALSGNVKEEEEQEEEDEKEEEEDEEEE
ncbi:hypothetical protein LOAG_13384, partial [Loa loa]